MIPKIILFFHRPIGRQKLQYLNGKPPDRFSRHRDSLIADKSGYLYESPIITIVQNPSPKPFYILLQPGRQNSSAGGLIPMQHHVINPVLTRHHIIDSDPLRLITGAESNFSAFDDPPTGSG